MAIKKILIVDDSPTERHVLNDMLTKAGYEVVASDNGEDAILKAKQLKPDLILMDVVMPGLNGFQATRAISRDPDTRSDPDHPVHVQEPGNRQDLGHAPGRARLRRQAGESRRAARQDRGARLNATPRPPPWPAPPNSTSARSSRNSRPASRARRRRRSSRRGSGSRLRRRAVADPARRRGRGDHGAAGRGGAAHAAVVPGRRQHPRQSLQRHRFRAASWAATPPPATGGPARAGCVLFGPRVGRPQCRHRRPARAGPAQPRRARAGSAARRMRRRGTASAGWTPTAARGRKSISRSSRSDPHFCRSGL